ncbi:hypothetical protein K505DRAFT_324120 [Melanomma pulvis-pyrius CBS 109.77]|uniref:Uncharacterized protein n=1 Tax=Melanomma pulvis-pyrius CBS 109.77 TaxID=1314802 RepID=A0A6A6XFI9_9PLEO|nr:hypothetical protein K505DRAFT_324120 [Melanomma pulvis-pyrius CBS 109.77]
MTNKHIATNKTQNHCNSPRTTPSPVHNETTNSTYPHVLVRAERNSVSNPTSTSA